MQELVEKYLKWTLFQIETRLTYNDQVLQKIWKDDDGTDWDAYCKKCDYYWKDNRALLTAESLIMPKDTIKMTPQGPLDKEGLVSIAEFRSYCRNAYILPSDGIGYYATATEVSDLLAKPYAFKEGYIRKDFTHVCWYTK